MPVFAAMGKSKSRLIAETVGSAMHHFGHHGQRPHGARADAGHQQQFGKIGRPALDGGRINGGIPDRVLNAGRAHAGARAALVHWELADAVRSICLEGQSVKSLAERTGEGRDVVVKLLKLGLDLLAVHYGMMGRKVG